MKSIIIYGSRYGSARRYAQELSKQTGIPDVSYQEAPLLCLEPCTGLQPGNHGCLRLEDRDGCVALSPGEVWEGSFWLSFS